MKQTTLGRDHPDLAICMNDRVDLLRAQVKHVVTFHVEGGGVGLKYRGFLVVLRVDEGL